VAIGRAYSCRRDSDSTSVGIELREGDAESAAEWGTFLRECGHDTEAEAEAVSQRADDLGAAGARASRRN